MIERINTRIWSHEVNPQGGSRQARVGGFSSTMTPEETDEFPIVMQALTTMTHQHNEDARSGFDYTFDFKME